MGGKALTFHSTILQFRAQQYLIQSEAYLGARNSLQLSES